MAVDQATSRQDGFWCSTDERSEGGELDLEGIDDREIEKVVSVTALMTSLSGADTFRAFYYERL